MNVGGLRVFVAGPEAGPDALTAIGLAAERLRMLGALVSSTADSHKPLSETTLDELLARLDGDMSAVRSADVLVYLPGSQEAIVAELVYAEALGTPTMSLSEALVSGAQPA